MSPESVDLLGEHADHVQKGLDVGGLDLAREVYCSNCGHQLGIRADGCCLAGVSFAEITNDLVQSLHSLVDTSERVALWCRHEADAIRSGGERQHLDSFASQPAGELAEDRRVE